LQSQQVVPVVTQQPEAYQMVTKTHGFWQAPIVLLQPSQGQGGPGNWQTVPPPAPMGLARSPAPAAAPMSAPVAT
jgi:hypothetical protein